MEKKTKTNIKDIFKGAIFSMWEDDDWIWLSTPYCTINFPKDEEILEDIKKDMQKISEL